MRDWGFINERQGRRQITTNQAAECKYPNQCQNSILVRLRLMTVRQPCRREKQTEDKDGRRLIAKADISGGQAGSERIPPISDIADGPTSILQPRLALSGMESNGIPDVQKPSSPGEVILQQRKDATQAAGQSAGDGSFWSQFSNNPFFTAVGIISILYTRLSKLMQC